MVLCRPLSSNDPDELSAMIRPAGGDLVVTQRGDFRSDAVQLNFDRLWMQHVHEELPRIWHNAASSRRAAIWFPSRDGPPILYQGAEVGAAEICLCPLGQQQMWQRLTGSSTWGSMSLPLEDWAGISAVAEFDPSSASVGGILRPRAAEMARLQRLHGSTSRLACDAPELMENSEVARGIEQSLLQAMVECLQPVANVNVPLHSRAKLMQRFRDTLDQFGDASVYVPELCLKLGVPSRTLSAICHEYLGLGPKRYLHLRRMHLARHALRASAAAATRVTDIATRFGFWELGRFAVEYKALFGESPSRTRPR